MKFKILRNFKVFTRSIITRSARPKFKLHKFDTQLYIDCGNLLIKNKFRQTGNYAFTRAIKGKFYERLFFIYLTNNKKSVTVNIYHPTQAPRYVNSINDMKQLIDNYSNELV